MCLWRIDTVTDSRDIGSRLRLAVSPQQSAVRSKKSAELHQYCAEECRTNPALGFCGVKDPLIPVADADEGILLCVARLCIASFNFRLDPELPQSRYGHVDERVPVGIILTVRRTRKEPLQK